jgi:hypothetical protein
MRTDLQPLSLSDLFDEAFDLYKKNFILFVGIIAFLHIPSNIILGAIVLSVTPNRFQSSSAPSNDPAQVGEAFGFLGVMMLIGMAYAVFLLLQNGALTLAVSERYLNRPITIRQSYRAALPHLFRLGVTWFLVGCIVAVVSFILVFAIAMLVGIVLTGMGRGGNPDQTVAMIIGLLVVAAVFIGAAFVMTWFGMYVTQTVMLERSGYASAIQRNFVLIKGKFLRSVVTMIVLFGIVQVLQLTIDQSIIGILDLTVYSWAPVPLVAQHGTALVLGSIITLFIQPFWMICLTVFYYDQRIRKEGFDIALAIRDMEVRNMEAHNAEASVV